jgi:mannan polymerase II complex ANP1 subunit
VISGESTLSRSAPTSVKIAKHTLTGLGPFLRLFSKSAINNASVPAKVICDIAFRNHSAQDLNSEPYYILDNEHKASSVIDVLGDREQMEEVLRVVMQQVNMS